MLLLRSGCADLTLFVASFLGEGAKPHFHAHFGLGGSWSLSRSCSPATRAILGLAGHALCNNDFLCAIHSAETLARVVSRSVPSRADSSAVLPLKIGELDPLHRLCSR